MYCGSDCRLLYIGHQQSIYRPTAVRSHRPVMVAPLLLLGGIEINQGPTTNHPLRLGALNVCSAVDLSKAALIHDVIESHHLDVMVVVETWMKPCHPASITRSITLTGFAVLHRFRSVGDHDGVAVIHRDGLQVAAVDTTKTVSSFEYLVIKLITRHRRINVIAVYRPPSSSKYTASNGQFCSKFGDLLDELLTFPGEVLLCGDFNCAQSDVVDIVPVLCDRLTSRNMVQHVDKPTNDKNHLLDLLVTVEGSSLVSNVDVIAVGFSNHHLVVTDLSVERPRPAVVTYSYRDIN